MATTLFERYGGFAAVSKVVLAFYDRVLDDEQVGPYFDDVDLPKLIDHQTKFISALMGGPASYNDEHLRKVHARHHISRVDFNRTAEILAEVLHEFGMQEEDVDAVMAEVHGRAPAIVDSDGHGH